MGTSAGLMFATSYNKDATLTVRECTAISQKRSCKVLPKLATLKEDITESKWYAKTTSLSKQVFLKIVNPDKNSYVNIDGTMMPYRSPASSKTSVWYEIENTNLGPKPYWTMTITWNTKSESDCKFQCDCKGTKSGCNSKDKCKRYEWDQST